MNGKVESANRSGFMPIVSLLLAVFLVAGIFAVMQAPVLSQDEDEPAGYPYTVQDGDSWDIVAAKTGVTVDVLQAANPDSVRDTGWLLTNEELIIPYAAGGESKSHTVESGESWSSIAEEYAISVNLLKAVNEQALRPGLVLYKGEKLVIPPALAADVSAIAEAEEASDTLAEEDTSGAEEVVAEEAIEEAATPELDETAPVSQTVEVSETVEAEVTPEADMPNEADEGGAAETEEAVAEDATAEDAIADETVADVAADEEPAAEDVAAGDAIAETEEPTTELTITELITETVIEAEVPAASEDEETASTEPVACPEALADYPETLVTLLAGPEAGADTVSAFLEGCGALVAGGVVAADLTGDGIEELVVVYQNPSQDSAFVESDLIILSATDAGYEMAYRARAAGEVRLLATEDINADEMVDVVWADTTCGASTCFDTVNVRSWDGSIWADWTDGTITMAYADIELVDETEVGSGEEIKLSGGIYGSVGAGPQRSRTEIWSSVEGAPYALMDKIYSESECLYHAVLDANRALQETESEDYLAIAKALYEKAVTDESLIKCWVRPGELEELRSFSLFRLAVIAANEGDLEGAADRITELAATYPDSPIAEASQAWLASIEADGDLAAACEVVTAFAEDNPEVWELLADYGYTNPSFEASDLCPPPDVSGEDTEESAEDGATGASPRSDQGEEGVVDSVAESSSADSGETDAEAAETIEATMPDCPVALVDYAEALPSVLTEMAGDKESIERWLYACGALAEDRGAVISADLNGDTVDDFVVYPTVISDVGLGPDGAQGSVVILHSQPDGVYTLAGSPDVFGKPMPLAVEDLNADGILDIAWTVEGCSTFCVLEAQIVAWDGEEYVSQIQPGAAIAAGQAAFAPVEADAVGAGQALVLSGGVSGTPEGGLTVPHEEVWQSIAGEPYQRIAWVYDREASGNTCMGLRMVEADVAMQASDVLGFEPAIGLYSDVLSSGLEACSIFGLRPDDELILLQGLAAFRLIQAQALSGELDSAQSSLDLLAMGMPGSLYASLAQQWMSEYTASGDAEAACKSVASILEENPDLWQITDHYGYNHPALAAEQICYFP